MSDTSEDFVSLPENAALDQLFVQPGGKTFQGKRLFPYSEGVKLLHGPIAAGVKGDEHWLMILMFLLLDLQEAYERQTAIAGTSEDDATDRAVAEILAIDAKTYQAKTIRRAGKLGKKGVAEAVRVATEIYHEAQDTELVAAEEVPDQPGK